MGIAANEGHESVVHVRKGAIVVKHGDEAPRLLEEGRHVFGEEAVVLVLDPTTGTVDVTSQENEEIEIELSPTMSDAGAGSEPLLGRQMSGRQTSMELQPLTQRLTHQQQDLEQLVRQRKELEERLAQISRDLTIKEMHIEEMSKQITNTNDTYAPKALHS